MIWKISIPMIFYFNDYVRDLALGLDMHYTHYQNKYKCLCTRSYIRIFLNICYFLCKIWIRSFWNRTRFTKGQIGPVFLGFFRNSLIVHKLMWKYFTDLKVLQSRWIFSHSFLITSQWRHKLRKYKETIEISPFWDYFRVVFG